MSGSMVPGTGTGTTGAGTAVTGSGTGRNTSTLLLITTTWKTAMYTLAATGSIRAGCPITTESTIVAPVAPTSIADLGGPISPITGDPQLEATCILHLVLVLVRGTQRHHLAGSPPSLRLLAGLDGQ